MTVTAKEMLDAESITLGQGNSEVDWRNVQPAERIWRLRATGAVAWLEVQAI